MKSNFKVIIALAVMVSFAFPSIFSSKVSADIADLTVQTGCSEAPSYTGILTLKEQSYDVFARLAKRGERAKVESFLQATDASYGDCKKIGTVTATGDEWKKVGAFTASNSQDYVLQLSSKVLKNIPDANRPSLMLVPKESPPCIPKKECIVSVDGQIGYVRPTGTLLNQDSLSVVEVVDPKKDQVESVRYYANDMLAYTTKTLETFDDKYIAFSDEKLTRVIVYDSGQQVVLESRSPVTFSDTFGNFLFRSIQKYPKIFIASMWISVLVLTSTLIIALLRIIRKRQDWRIHHGFARQKEMNLFQRIFYGLQVNKAAHVIRIVAFGGVLIGVTLGLVVFVSTYFLQITTIDGHSMEKTYFTGDQVLVNKIPKTVANINGLEYVPARGEVVIVRAAFGNAILSTENTTDLTLIKRVIGLPGERIIIKNGELTVYNTLYPNGFRPDSGSKWEAAMTADEKNENIDIQLGSSEIFVSGDNRPESIDSRFNGPIKTKEIIGLVAARVWQGN
jgi:signal peptidase I